MKRRVRGFTLIEMMVTVAIVGVLTAVALPQYRAYLMRGRVTEALTALAGVQPSAEQYWSNNRTYVGFDTAAAKRMPAATTNFTYALSDASTTSYTITATGAGPMLGFVYTLNQTGERATSGVPSGWTTSTTCWVDRSDGSCSQ